jgi:hypothetical protein
MSESFYFGHGILFKSNAAVKNTCIVMLWEFNRKTTNIIKQTVPRVHFFYKLNKNKNIAISLIICRVYLVI